MRITKSFVVIVLPVSLFLPFMPNDDRQIISDIVLVSYKVNKVTLIDVVKHVVVLIRKTFIFLT